MMRKRGKQASIFLGICFCLCLIAGCSIAKDNPLTQATATATPTPAQGKPITIAPADTATPTPTATATPVTTSTPAPAPTSGVSGESSSEIQIAQAVFQAINQSRAAANLPALQWSTALMKSAHQHNLAMVAAQVLSHQLPGEPALGARETAQGVQWSWAGENIGYTSDLSQAGALGLHQAMMAEKPPDDGHRQNILTTLGNIVGVDIILDTQHQRLWLTEDFARA